MQRKYYEPVRSPSCSLISVCTAILTVLCEARTSYQLPSEAYQFRYHQLSNQLYRPHPQPSLHSALAGAEGEALSLLRSSPEHMEMEDGVA